MLRWTGLCVWSSWIILLMVTMMTMTGVVQGSGGGQVIETVLHAKWSPTSGLMEAGEFVSDVQPSLFWTFLDNVMTQVDNFAIPPQNTDETEIDLASVAAFPILSPAKLRLMEWAITSKAFSPRVTMFQQLAPESDCESFVHFSNNKITCDIQEIKKIVESTEGFSDNQNDHLLITEYDHKFPSFLWNQLNPPVAILYGHPLSKLTTQLHQYLKTKGDKIGYIFRPYSSRKGGADEKLVLSGYGVEHQFKSTEYLAQDDSDKLAKDDKTKEIGGFLFDKLHELHPGKGENLEKFQNHLASLRGKKSEFEALKAWQVQELGLQASHFTTLQENILESLIDITGNFPSKAASLSSVRVPSEFKKSVAFNQQILASHFSIDEGEGAFFLQGNYLDPDSLDLFTFMDTLKSEIELMELLKSVHHDKPAVTRSKVEKILSLGSKTNSEPELALDLRDSSIYWMNDLEKDEEYEGWPDDLTQLFYRMGGVMLRPVRRNVFNLVLTVDSEDLTTTGSLLKIVHSFMEHKAPVRIGVVFCDSKKKEIISNSIDDDSSGSGQSISQIIRKVLNYAQSQEMMRKAFATIVDAYSSEDFSKVLKAFTYPDEEYNYGGQASCEYVQRSGRPTPGGFLNGVPLKWDSPDDFEETVLNQLLKEAQSIQIESYNGKIKDDTDIFEYLMNKPNVLTRLNDKILDTSSSKFLSFGTEIWELGKNVKNEMGSFAASLVYLQPSGGKRKENNNVGVTHWILTDVGTPAGHSFLQNAVEFLSESAKHSRIAYIHTGEHGGSSAFKRMLQSAFDEGDIKKISKILKDFSDDGDDGQDQENSKDDEKRLEFLKSINFPLGSQGVVVNGRLIGPLDKDEKFELGDWALVEKVSYDSCAKHFDEDWDGDSIMRICSLLENPTIKARNAKRFTLPEFENAQTIESVGGGGGDPFTVDITGVIDPASRVANKMATILNACQDTLGQWLRIRILFNPPSKHSELPLKSYFRYVAGEKPAERVVFENIPKDPLFTQNFISPDNWMVEVKNGEHDLDNIRLRDMTTSIQSEYELEYLLVEGHCLELKTGSPPRGVQFNFEPTNKGGKLAETIVMANLGYFQLKAGPGIWKLSLRDGPSKEIYNLESSNSLMMSQVVQSFQSIVLKVKIKRNPGKEMASVLDSEEDSNGNWFGFGGNKNEKEDDVINVFSLASGHLYERLARIMMMSVLKNTKSKVKFWFLKNYLSPTFKNILPEMAKEYNFDYELVQYHWPRWLNPQREKQRIIWGYKILFLDVLFPLSLKKIVFVDADQIVRTDLKELFELDLEGNPYGYTPFCDSRTEMEGFRFWKNGYWKSHLGRRKYHISALYVVDLLRFRKIAAGDRLRGQYQALSQDPNSLSNLDQDLPNNMIHQVGIKSLPQEWLWCETWCSDESKAAAKTIDLCNNPQTKEPKLDAAQRIVPEWTGYDQEIREFIKRLNKKSESESESAEAEAEVPTKSIKKEENDENDDHDEL